MPRSARQSLPGTHQPSAFSISGVATLRSLESGVMHVPDYGIQLATSGAPMNRMTAAGTVPTRRCM